MRRKSRKNHNKYRTLKVSLLLRTVLVTAIAGVISAFVMVYFVDGFFDDQFPRFFSAIFMKFGSSRGHALEVYWHVIGNNKSIFMIVFFVLLFFIIFYGTLSTLTRYLEEVEDCIDEVDSEDDEPFVLIEELKPIEDKLNDLKKKLKEQARDAEETERKKNDLVLFLAHDLKTPLTSIVAYMQRLDEDPDMNPVDRKKYIHIAHEKSIRLSELIAEFFEITRFNLQTIRLEKSVINLSMMLEQIADELYAVLEQKHMTAQVQADEDILLYGDPDKLARVFDNLLRNAVSYSYAGTQITIVAREIGEWTEIVFSNHSDTISKGNLKQIFDKFYRADTSRSSSTGGAGLGLAIAKEIVELHDGRISATSIDGETSFVVVLPREDEDVRQDKERKFEEQIEAARRLL